MLKLEAWILKSEVCHIALNSIALCLNLNALSSCYCGCGRGFWLSKVLFLFCWTWNLLWQCEHASNSNFELGRYPAAPKKPCRCDNFFRISGFVFVWLSLNTRDSLRMHRIVEIGHDLPRMEENGGTPTRSQFKASHMFEFQELSLKKIMVTTSCNWTRQPQSAVIISCSCGCGKIWKN